MSRRCAFLIFLAGVLSASAHALQVQVGITSPFVFIQIGNGQYGVLGLLGPPANQINVVSFAFPAGVLPGDGTPIVGTPVIPVAVLGYNGGGQANFRVTINSAAPLTNGNGDTLPFSEFSWTAQDGDINNGQFNDTANQLLQQYSYTWPQGRGVIDYLTFSYDNDQIFSSGTYAGRVVYTITEL